MRKDRVISGVELTREKEKQLPYRVNKFDRRRSLILWGLGRAGTSMDNETCTKAPIIGNTDREINKTDSDNSGGAFRPEATAERTRTVTIRNLQLATLPDIIYLQNIKATQKLDLQKSWVAQQFVPLWHGVGV